MKKHKLLTAIIITSSLLIASIAEAGGFEDFIHFWASSRWMF